MMFMMAGDSNSDSQLEVEYPLEYTHPVSGEIKQETLTTEALSTIPEDITFCGADQRTIAVGMDGGDDFGAFLLMNQINMAMLAFTLTGSLLGFLKYNFSPARIFMGDTGSLVIGMIFSVLAINLIGSGIVYEKICYPNKGPLLAIVFLALPLFDSLRVFLNRVKKGKNPLLAGKDHVHHAMLFLGLGHKKTSLILYFTSIFIIITSYFMLDININNSITILAFECYILLLIPFYILRKKSNEI